jgi:putative membrane-bound dehydrogenase-like protein
MQVMTRLFGIALISTWIVIGLGVRPAPAWSDDLAAELPRIKPLSPEAALGSLKIRPGFRLRTVAAEPLVADPVSACFDADGRLYVVEMCGYPYPEKSPSGKVRLLTDADGDGTFETGSTFLDGMTWATSIVPYDGGVFIAVPPAIIYAKDTDGDGVADIKKEVFRGFGTSNVQALVNGLLWGPDGWIYGISGGNGGEIVNVSRPGDKPVSVRGRDFRFRPDGSAFEAISGGGQFGHAFDDWGHRFTCNNSNHIRQIALPSHYLERRPSLTVPAVVFDIAAEGPASPVYRLSPPEPWRVVRTRQRVADPAFDGRLAATERVAAGFFTSATGVTIYRGSAFPPDARGNAFIGDVGGNLVHRKVLTRPGAAFLATRAEPGSKTEFIASPDNWFRPVNFANTPNGTLLVLDMYRETIEHPFSIPEPIKRHLDLTSGSDRGRLYEILPDQAVPVRRPHLSGAKTAALVGLLADPDAWWRETAQRLLIERRDPSAIPMLKELAAKRPTALGRVHALWTLGVLGKLAADDLIPALADAEPGVREQAAKLTEGRIAGNHAAVDRLLALADDPDPMVRFQAAFSLGELPDPRVATALATITARDRSSPLVRTAVLSSLTGRFPAYFEGLARMPGFFASEDGRSWLQDLAALAGSGGRPEEVRAVIAYLANPQVTLSSRSAAAMGLDRGLRYRGGNLRDRLRGETSVDLGPVFAAARRDAKLDSLSPASRIEAIRVLALEPPAEALDDLAGLLDPRQPVEIQLVALQSLAELPGPRVGPLILERWASLGPSIRREAFEVLFARTERLNALLDAIEAKTLTANQLDPARRKQLITHADPAIRARGAKLVVANPGEDRRRVLVDWRAALSRTGDRDKGRAVFDKVCATCHKAEGRGMSVGPDLATVTGRTPDDLLGLILDPNREVPPQYLNYSVATTDGRVFTGLIADESAGVVTLKRAGGLTDVIPRDRIDAISSTGISLMPEGLEKGLSQQDMADLIAFLRGPQGAVR